VSCSSCQASPLCIGPYVVGEVQPPLVYQFLDSSGAPIDLTAYQVAFIVKERSGSPTSYTGALYDAANGQVSYAWTGAEWPTPGRYEAEFFAGNGTNRYASLLITFTVRASVGPVPAI
jgi:hypothetical protein